MLVAYRVGPTDADTQASPQAHRAAVARKIPTNRMVGNLRVKQIIPGMDERVKKMGGPQPTRSSSQRV